MPQYDIVQSLRRVRSAGSCTSRVAVMFLLWLAVSLFACDAASPREILVGVDSGSLGSLRPPAELEPGQTGIASLDELNEKWGVLAVSAVFPDIAAGDEVAARQGLQGILKLVVPGDTDIAAMIAEYQANPHITYVEENKPVEIK